MDSRKITQGMAVPRRHSKRGDDMLTQSEMDKLVLEAKKSLSDEQIKDAIRKCSYGGSIVNRPLDCHGINMKGGMTLGKANA